MPFLMLFLLVPEPHLALLCYFPATLLSSMWTGPTYSAVQGLASLRMRATASAVLLFLINFIGLGIGPQVVGLLSDWLEPSWARESIRYALLIVAFCKLWGALHSALSARHLRAELAQARAAA